jgi:hypothetical protein
MEPNNRSEFDPKEALVPEPDKSQSPEKEDQGIDSEPDFDLGPADSFPRSDYPLGSKKNPLTVWLGVLVVAVVIGLTYFAFQKPSTEAPVVPPPPAVKPASPETPGALPEKVPDAADFSPTPETEAAAAHPSLPATVSSSNPPPVVAPSVETRPEPKPAPKPAAKPEVKPEAKPEPKPEAKLGPKPEAKPEPKPEPKPEAKPEAKPEVKPEAKPADEVKISDVWVVNISSTPDAAESLRVLEKVLASEAGGQVYSYETTIDGNVNHRVRVGFFATRAEAEAIGLKIKEEHKLFSTPWAVQPNVDEVERYKKK